MSNSAQFHRTFAPLSVLLIAGLAAACSPAAKEKERSASKRQDTAIVHGKAVSSKESLAQSVVALVAEVDGGQALCTGSLVSDDIVLTAAHCVDHDPTKLTVVFSHDTHTAKDSDVRAVDHFTQNHRWQNPTKTGRGDLALLHFTGGLPDGYQPVELEPSSFNIGDGASTLMLGFGVTDGLSHAGSGVLRETETAVIGRESKTEVITDGQKSSVCFGDSGGPAFVNLENQWVQWGVASSVANQSCNEASVHTDLHSYLKWIESASKKLKKSKDKNVADNGDKNEI